MTNQNEIRIEELYQNEHFCSDCKHADKPVDEEPCASCDFFHRNFEPKET